MQTPSSLLIGFLTLWAVGVASPADPAPIPFKPDAIGEVNWYSAKEIGVEGRGWTEVKEYYDRLPAKAEGIVREPVWNLSRHSAGLNVRFLADTPSIAVHWKVGSAVIAKPHMAATGVSGVDLYGRMPDGTWRWIAVGKPGDQNNKQTLAKALPSGRREYRVYLPLYNSVTELLIGLPTGVKMERVDTEESKRKPIVFYGTSIIQGACASRAGMAPSSIIGRRLDRPMINLGFAGQGKMEIEMAELLAELDAAAFVLDALPNMGAAEIKVRAEPMVRAIRRARPHTPIILVEDRTYANAVWSEEQRGHNQSSRIALKAAYERLRKAGVEGLTYVEGAQLLSEDGEETVDGSHPTDLGFARYVRVLLPVLESALAK